VVGQRAEHAEHLAKIGDFGVHSVEAGLKGFHPVVFGLLREEMRANVGRLRRIGDPGFRRSQSSYALRRQASAGSDGDSRQAESRSI